VVSGRKSFILRAEQKNNSNNPNTLTIQFGPFENEAVGTRKIFILLRAWYSNTFKAVFILGFRSCFTFQFNLKGC